MRWGWAVGIVAALLIVAMFLAHRDQPIRPTVISGMAMGTHYHIKLAGVRPPRDGIERDVQALMEEIQVQASQWRELSWVSRFNAGDSLQPVPVPAHVWAMLLVAEEVYHQSGGLVDVTVGPLVQLWGSGHEPNTVSPPDEEVARTLARCGFDKLVLEPPARTVRRTVPGVQIDLSSLAKGYAVDRIDGLLQSYGLGNYVIEFGGEVLARGGRASVSAAIRGLEYPAARPSWADADRDGHQHRLRDLGRQRAEPRDRRCHRHAPDPPAHGQAPGRRDRRGHGNGGPLHHRGRVGDRVVGYHQSRGPATGGRGGHRPDGLA